jgi:hypothetical protein
MLNLAILVFHTSKVQAMLKICIPCKMECLIHPYGCYDSLKIQGSESWPLKLQSYLLVSDSTGLIQHNGGGLNIA